MGGFYGAPYHVYPRYDKYGLIGRCFIYCTSLGVENKIKLVELTKRIISLQIVLRVLERALLKYKLSNRKIFSQLSTGEEFPVMF